MVKKKYERDSLKLSRRTLLKAGVLSFAAAGSSTIPKLKARPMAPLGFCPTTGFNGQPIRVFGPDFGPNLEDIRVRILAGDLVGFIRPMSFQGDELATEICSLPPASTDGPVEVTLGTGYQNMPGNMPSQLTLTDPICTWLGNGGARFTSYQNFDVPPSGTTNCLSYWAGLSAGRLSLDIVVPYDEDCCPICPAGTRLSLRFCGNTSGNIFDCEYQATLINTVPLYTHQIADALCTVMESAFFSDFGITMSCQQTVIDDTRVNISIGTPDASPFIGGAINVALTHEGGSIDCDSMEESSMESGSMASMSMDCQSIGMDCPSIDVDFNTFVFT